MDTTRTVFNSKAIHSGADILMSLIENERAKAAATAERELADFKNQFGASVVDSRGRCREAEVSAKELQDQLTAALSDVENANSKALAARKEAAEARMHLEHIKATFGKVGVIFGPDYSINIQGDLATLLSGQENQPKSKYAVPPNVDDTNTHADHKNAASPLSVDPARILVTLRETMDKNRAGLAQWRERCHVLEREQQQLKGALETKVADFMTQISSLQAELNSLKASHDSPPIGPARTTNSDQKTEKVVEPSRVHPLSTPNRCPPSNERSPTYPTPRLVHSDEPVSSVVGICDTLPPTLVANAKTSAAESPSADEATGSPMSMSPASDPSTASGSLGKRPLDPESLHVNDHLSKHHKRD